MHVKKEKERQFFSYRGALYSLNVLIYLRAAITAPTAYLRGSCWMPLTNFKLKPKQKARVLLLLHVKQAPKKALL